MERVLINQEYLRELMHVADDQNESDLVLQLFKNLLKHRSLFIDQTKNLLADNEKLQFELHKLKNQFANLGCEAASAMLEDMYQLAKKHETEKILEKMDEFLRISDETIENLQFELNY